jgi:hypothetical protein
MTTHSSAQRRAETPHATNETISDAVRHRAQSLVNDKSIDASGRVWLRYALEINDPYLPELIRRADAGEPIIDDSHLLESNQELSTEQRVERLVEIICRDQPETTAAALLVLMSTVENSAQPKVLANQVKHIAFTRCGELNCYGMVDAQIAAIETELLIN